MRFISFSFPMIPMAHRCISFHHGWSIHWTSKASIDGSVFLLELLSFVLCVELLFAYYLFSTSATGRVVVRTYLMLTKTQILQKVLVMCFYLAITRLVRLSMAHCDVSQVAIVYLLEIDIIWWARDIPAF